MTELSLREPTFLILTALAAGLMDAPWPPVYPKQPGEPPRVAPSRARTAD